MTAVVLGIGTIDVFGTHVGTYVPGMTIGDYGIVGTTMYSFVGTSGMLFGVTNGVVNLTLNGGVGKVTIDTYLIVVGTTHVGTMTAVVPGIVTIDVFGTHVGTSVIGTITGDGGIVVTTIYYDVGTFGMLPGVTNGVVNLIVYGVCGNEYYEIIAAHLLITVVGMWYGAGVTYYGGKLVGTHVFGMITISGLPGTVTITVVGTYVGKNVTGMITGLGILLTVAGITIVDGTVTGDGTGEITNSGTVVGKTVTGTITIDGCPGTGTMDVDGTVVGTQIVGM
jgi:hypothetical protein